MSVLDCHCHLSFMSLEEAKSVLSNAPEDQQWIFGGYQPSEWEAQIELKKLYPDRFQTCFGLHPWYIKSSEFDLARDIESLKLWADQADFIGEVGLDFFGDESILKKDMQLNVFEQQLELNTTKPFVLHIVQAHGKALDILKNYSIKGFVHSFSGSIEVAEKYLSHNILLSFGPNILNENFKNARETLAKLPLEAILIESDTPSNAIDENNPLDKLQKVYEEAAKIKEIDVEDLKQQVIQNFKSLIDLA